MAYAAALAAMVDELDGWIARHDARVDAWHEGILYARAGDWQPGPDDETSACWRSTATPTGCGAWTPPRRGASPTRRASSAA